jgi:hypothetical protein
MLLEKILRQAKKVTDGKIHILQKEDGRLFQGPVQAIEIVGKCQLMVRITPQAVVPRGP